MSKQSENKQKVSGVILIDKPKGISSQQVVSKVKYLFMSPAYNSKKAGHTGTLDPMATGLLPVCLGEATKFSHYQLDADKSYQAVIKLGIQTDTGDAEGVVTKTLPIPAITDDLLQMVQAKFTGHISQIPPMYSALKKDGKKLYEYAREGIEVERDSRNLIIHDLTISKIADDELLLTVKCSKGTYVRVLGEDIAKSLGTTGTLGHLIELRRVAVGKFGIADAITLEALEQLAFDDRFNCLLPVDTCIDETPQIVLDDLQVIRIRKGQRLNVFELISKAWFSKDERIDVRMFDKDTVFLGLASLESTGRLQPTKVVNL